MHEDKAVDEVLEFIWSEREEGRNSIEALLRIDELVEEGADMTTLREMASGGLVRIDGDGISLTDRGESLAELAIRRHRLAERLLTEVLSM
ncbi:MAG: DtxR family transcriptional regulator, partial [Thermodesulfobacteriota bacterium]